jgi:RHS repeat-associated protein
LQVSGSTQTTNFFLSDGLGSLLGVFSNTASSASLLASQLYYPYGVSRYGSGTVSPYTAKGFTGQYNDPTSGLDYYGARYYDPVVGLFVSADKQLGDMQGANPYAYVGQNPETETDPTGEMYAPPPPGGQGVTARQLNSDAVAFTQHTAPVGGYLESTLPWLLYLFLYNHQASSALEGQAENQGYSLQPLLSQQAADYLAFRSDANWKASQALRALYAQLTLLSVMHLVQTLGSSGMEDHPDLLSSEEALETMMTNSEDALAGGCSFTAKTLVTTEQGKEPIGKLHIGEKVLAYNPNTKQMEDQPILHVFLDHDNDLVDLTLTTIHRTQQGRGVSRQSEVIHTNQKHPFLTKEKGFLPVGQIKLGMHVRRADGTYGVVTGWKVVAGAMTMYNLEVAQDHTFTVGAGEWVVHNNGPSCGGDSGKIYNAGGDPTLRAARKSTYQDWMQNGVDVDGANFSLSQHAYNSLMKSGRKDIMPDDIIDALKTDPQPAAPGSVQYINSATGTRVFVNPDTNSIVGIWPAGFK